jgi:hypothetical protein
LEKEQMNIEQGMSKEEGGHRHEKAQEDTRSLVRRISISRVCRVVYLLNSRVFRGYLISQLVPFFIRHSLFDILRFRQWLAAPFG